VRLQHRKCELLLIVLLLAVLGGFIGCELSDPPLPVGSGGGLGLSLIYPPATGAKGDKSFADSGTVRVWLYRLGVDELAAYGQRPAVGDDRWVPAAYAQGPGDGPLSLNIVVPTGEHGWRLFVESDTLGGNTTFCLRRSNPRWVVHVALAPDSIVTDRFTIYEGFAAGSLSGPAGNAPGETTVIYPVALENTRSLKGLEMRFLVEADSARVFIDHGSRFYAAGEQEAVSIDLRRLDLPDPNTVAYELEIFTNKGDDQNALIETGHDILFYLVAYGSAARTDICVDPDGAFIYAANDDAPTAVAVQNPGDCLFPPTVIVTVASPGADEICVAGDIVQLRWTTVGSYGDRVRIDLIHLDKVCATIAAATANDGAFDWPAERCNTEAEGYRIRITDLTSGESGDSDGSLTIDPADSIGISGLRP